MKKKLITLALIAVSSAAIGFAALAVSVTPSAASDTKLLIHTHARPKASIAPAPSDVTARDSHPSPTERNGRSHTAANAATTKTVIGNFLNH